MQKFHSRDNKHILNLHYHEEKLGSLENRRVMREHTNTKSYLFLPSSKTLKRDDKYKNTRVS